MLQTGANSDGQKRLRLVAVCFRRFVLRGHGFSCCQFRLDALGVDHDGKSRAKLCVGICISIFVLEPPGVRRSRRGFMGASDVKA